MSKFLQHLVDFIFPPTQEELELREISPAGFFKTISKASTPEFPFISSIFSYKNPLAKELIWQIKYKKNKHAAQIAAFAIKEVLQDADFLLIPIPISKKRRNERGYNQCEIILDSLEGFKKDYSLLKRAKHIDKQTFKNRNERIENTKNIFEVTRSGREKIILIDDVSTTGSTLKEAREAFILAGYSDVTALTIAH